MSEKAEDNPYLNVKREWNEIFSNEIIAKYNWQKVAFISLIMNFIVIISFIALSMQHKTVPYIVEVDNLGSAIAYKQAEQIEEFHPKIIKAHLYKFIENTKGISNDQILLQNNLDFVYKNASTNTTSFLNEFYQHSNSMELSKSIKRQVIPSVFLKESDDTYLIEWKEIDRSLNNKIIKESRWKGLFSISRTIPTEQDLHDNPFNPFGIYITNISWNQIS